MNGKATPPITCLATSNRIRETGLSCTQTFPSDEKFGLVSQMRRSAVSISSNIAEGAARNTPKEFDHFLHIAQGSAAELETQIIISRELELLARNESEKLVSELDEISKMVIGLQRSLKTRS